MAHIYLFDKVSELKEKFKRFFYHKKKLQALENYSLVVPFQHKDYLLLIKRCMNDGFLGEKEADFLSYMVDKYFSEQNFLDWSCKTKWLKGEIERLTSYQKPKQIPLFDFNKERTAMGHVPLEILSQSQKMNIGKRA